MRDVLGAKSLTHQGDLPDIFWGEIPTFRVNLEIGDTSKLQIFSNPNIFRESEIPIFSEILNYFREIRDI